MRRFSQHLNYWWWFALNHQAYFNFHPKEWRLSIENLYYDGNNYVICVGPFELCLSEY